VRFSTDGGVTFDASAIYDVVFNYTSTTGGGSGTSSTNGDHFDIGGDGSNVVTAGLAGSMSLSNPLSATAYKSAWGTFSYGHNSVGRIFINRNCLYKNTAPVNAVRFYYPSGNASGTIRLYGYAK
jgi:hypothetical protein